VRWFQSPFSDDVNEVDHHFCQPLMDRWQLDEVGEALMKS